MCEKRRYDNQFLIRSLARGDRNKDSVIDEFDYECLHFPRSQQQYTNPIRVPQTATADGNWLGESMASDLDGNGDPECGIFIEEGVGDSQGSALVSNKQAAFTLISLSP